MSNLTEKKDFLFKFDPEKCLNCEGNCCTGKSGYIWVTQEEQYLIAEFINETVEKLKADYLRSFNGVFSIKELKINGNYHCVFFDTDKKRCSIYEVRPEQCRTFPFWEYYRGKIELLKEECPGIIIEETESKKNENT